jgi:hypothetical protein
VLASGLAKESVTIVVETRFAVPTWDEPTRRKVIGFWEERRVEFDAVDGDTLVGHRGSLFGNLLSFDMTKLRAELTVTYSAGHIHARIAVNTVGQTVTEWNRAWWLIEMCIFESWVVDDNPQAERWQAFLDAYHNHAKSFSVTPLLEPQIPSDHKWLLERPRKKKKVGRN